MKSNIIPVAFAAHLAGGRFVPPAPLKHLAAAFDIRRVLARERGAFGEITVRRAGTCPRVKLDSPEGLEKAWRVCVTSQRTFDPSRMSLFVFCTNVNLWLTGWARLTIGTRKETVANPADVLRTVMLADAEGFVTVQNCPSGATGPSRDVRVVVSNVKAVAAVAGLRFLDHILIGSDVHGANDDPYSFRANGLL